MDAFAIAQLLPSEDRLPARYREFIRNDSLSVGVYSLAADAQDPQQPHSEDEVYYVVQGRGAIEVAGESRSVESGAVIFVGAGVVHHFHSISEEMTILVFFAPAEHTRDNASEQARKDSAA